MSEMIMDEQSNYYLKLNKLNGVIMDEIDEDT